MTESIAVIVPAHNAAEFISATLASIASQSRLPDEVVVADDCSTDDTAGVARRWIDHLPIRVLRLDHNLGPAGARHAAIQSSESAAIALLDADDLMLPDHLETMASLLAVGTSLVSADPLSWIPGRAVASRPWSHRHPLPAAPDQRTSILERNFVHVACMFERSLYELAGGFREQFWGTEDWDLWIRMLRVGATVTRPDHATALYRLSTNSISADEALNAQMRAVLEHARRETSDPNDLAAIARGERLVAATGALYAAYAHAEGGRHFAARRAALRALRGTRNVTLRGALVALAPGRATRARDARREAPRWWLNR